MPDRGKTWRKSRDVFCYLCHTLLLEERKGKWVSVESPTTLSLWLSEEWVMVSVVFSVALDHKTKCVFPFPGIAKTLPSFPLI